MAAVVITPPAPLVTPEKIPGGHAADDGLIAALIAAATEEIDGPGGWLGRAIGPQTLELRLAGFNSCGRPEIELPCPPLISVDSVKYDAESGEATVPSSAYSILRGRVLALKPGASWPAVKANGEVRIRYRAGYDGTTTGQVPERVRQAIILLVNDMKSASAENLFLASEEVPGVSTQRFVVSAAAGEVIQRTVDRLLSGLRVFA